MVGTLHAQDEEVKPLLGNPHLKPASAKNRSNHTIDSTFIYAIDTLDLPVWDDFSVDRFMHYDAGYSDVNVTSQWYFYLMNSTNTVEQDPAVTFCDSIYALHNTIVVELGIAVDTVTVNWTTPTNVWANDLTTFPVQGALLTPLYGTTEEACYVLIDSIIDSSLDPDQDTLWYPLSFGHVQDSAQVFFVDYNDPSTIWVDSLAYRNFRYAVNPWSLGVATFDGVDASGWPYDWGNTSAHEQADVLTSRPINLAGKVNVYLTFIFQAEGYGNAPEVDDTLLLDWWLPDSNKWFHSGWYALGGTVNDVWDTVHWAVPTAALDDGFRFRFRNWASTSGNLDHWHIDYVSLEDNDLPTVSNFSDLAISVPINSIIDTYTAVPWDHFKNANAADKMLDTLKVRVYNSDLTPTNFANGEMTVYHQGLIEAGPYVLGNPAITSEWTGNWELGMNRYPYALASNYVIDQSITTDSQAALHVKLNIDAAVSASNSHLVNDTTYHLQDFRNFYSYDDGSAEAAYGITGSHSMLAYRFDSYEEDTLTGILMHWVPSVDDHSEEGFLLTIWADNGGQPGEIIYQDDYFNLHYPEYSGSLNGFKYYTFMNDAHIKVPQTFYVGWEQIETESMNIGLDWNIDNGDKVFRNTSGTWQTTSFDISLLIRPVFSTAMNNTLGIDTRLEDDVISVQLYPNPTNGQVNLVTAAEDYSVRIYDLSGREVFMAVNESQFDLAYLQPGVYLVDVRDVNGVSLYSGKLVKE